MAQAGFNKLVLRNVLTGRCEMFSRQPIQGKSGEKVQFIRD